MPAPSMLRSLRNDPARHEAIDRVRELVRERFVLGEDTAIMVAEVACNLPGCPPLETAIAFWRGERRHHYKVFKPVAEVAGDDLPPRWFMSAMAVPDDFECTCC